MRILTLMFVFHVASYIYGQNPVSPFDKFQQIKTTQSYNLNPRKSQPKTNPIVVMNTQTKMSVQERNRMVIQMQQSHAKMPPTQAEIKKDIERQRQMNYRRQHSYQEKQRQAVYSIINEDNPNHNKQKETRSYSRYGRYRFANHNSVLYKNHIGFYEKAYSEIEKMLKGEKPLSVKDAIFHSENAFYGGELAYDEFNKQITEYKHLIKVVAKKYQLDLTNNIAIQFAIQKLFSDTIYDSQTNQYFPPLTYDFEDIKGDENYSQLFVSKLMSSGKGQCHSMPLLHKILSDEFKGEAYLAYAPSHSYIRFKDDRGRFINFETTNGSLTTNNFVVGSGYIKSEAILNKIYTKEVNTKELIAQLLSELATMFQHQLGYDNFIEKCTSTTLEHYPRSITAHMEKSNFETAKLDKALYNISYPPYEKIKEYSKEYQQLKLVLALYNNIDKLGYSKMPKEAYEKWLNSLEEERQKQEDEKLRLQLNFNKYE